MGKVEQRTLKITVFHNKTKVQRKKHKIKKAICNLCCKWLEE